MGRPHCAMKGKTVFVPKVERQIQFICIENEEADTEVLKDFFIKKLPQKFVIYTSETAPFFFKNSPMPLNGI